MAVPRGFKAAANRISVGLRRQVGLRASDPIDLLVLADRLAVSVIPLSTLEERCPDQVRQLTASGGEGFSAALVSFGNGQRAVIVNDRHSVARQNSNIAHELSHSLLAHPLEVLSNLKDCRDFNSDIEDEANHLAGYILIPDQAARRIAYSRMAWELAQADYGVSKEMLVWRMNMSGAAGQIRQKKR